VSVGRAALPAAIVLAAGASRRLGRPKLALRRGGESVLSRAVRPLLGAGLRPVVVVLGAHAPRVRSALALDLRRDPRLLFVSNARWREGMASSIRRGVEAVAGCPAVVIALADQVGVSERRVRALVRAWRLGARLAAPRRDGRAAHPVLFDRSLMDGLARLSGDRGARELVRRHLREVAWLPVRRSLHDLDSRADVRLWRAGAPAPRTNGWRIPASAAGVYPSRR
jgi:molybdenum cofactor cytidylyltransferase